VSYSRLVPQARNPVHDAPGNNAANTVSLKAKDGIFPTAPTLSLVDGKQKWTDTGRFYTNNAAPALTLTGLSNGDGVILYEHLPSGNVKLCSTGQVQGPTATCNVSGWSANAVHLVQGYVGDGVNTTYFGPYAPIVEDHTNPAMTSATVDKAGRTVTVNVNDLLGSGRNFAVDWQVTGSAGGQPVSYAIQSVVVASPTTRVLHIDPADSNWTAGTVTTASYTFVGGTAADRYADRAGNFLPDGSAAIS
jgi:methionine-rich copper-binding protein CopC